MNIRTTILTRRWGSSRRDPTQEELKSALEELAKNDLEHPDCSLSDQDGWTISVGQSGIVCLENIETDEGPWHLSSLNYQQVLALWQLLQYGKLDEIRQYPWADGYGS